MIIEVSIMCGTALVLGTFRFVQRVHREEIAAGERMWKMANPDVRDRRLKAIEKKRQILERERLGCFTDTVRGQPGVARASGSNAKRVFAIDEELKKLADEEAGL